MKVAEVLLSSLDAATQQRIDSLWGAEAEDRLGAVDRGEIKTFPAQKVFDEIRKKNG